MVNSPKKLRFEYSGGCGRCINFEFGSCKIYDTYYCIGLKWYDLWNNRCLVKYIFSKSELEGHLI